MGLLEKWGNLGLLDDIESIEDKTELANLLEDIACHLMVYGDDYALDVGGSNVGVLIFPAIVRIYRVHGVHNVIKLLNDLLNFWRSNEFHIMKYELTVITGIDWEAELLAYFCENYTPSEDLKPYKFMKNFKLSKYG